MVAEAVDQTRTPERARRSDAVVPVIVAHRFSTGMTMTADELRSRRPGPMLASELDEFMTPGTVISNANNT